MFDFLNKLDDELKGMAGKGPKKDKKEENKGSKKPEVKKEAKVKKKPEANIPKQVTNDEVVITSVSNTKKPQTDNSNSAKPAAKKPARKPSNKFYNKNPKTTKFNRREKFISSFPDTRFFLPSLREKHTRYIPIGGNDETGAKNMGMFQYGDDIILADCGVMFADESLPGVDYAIPDVSFLKKYTKQIKGFLITHAHLDHIGALKHIVPALDFPVLYGTKLTLGLIKKGFEEAGIMNKTTFIEIDASKENHTKLGGFDVEFFSINHSIPDSAGLFIESDGGATFFHTGDFKIDMTPAIDAPADIERFKAFGERGVTMLLSDSTGSIREGRSKSEKEVGETLAKIVEGHNSGRLLIATFSSWISRVQQLIDVCEQCDKVIFLSGRSMIENVAIAKNLGYLRMKPGTMKKMTPKTTEGIPAHKQVIITTGSQGEEFSALTRMAGGLHNSIEIIKGDTVVFSSSVVPGNDRPVVAVINKLIKLGANVITKDDMNVHTGGHGQKEEQRDIINYTKPKFFTPIYGDMYFRSLHAKTAMEEGIKEENILMLNNGDITDFTPDKRAFRSKIKVPLQDIIIDGNGMGTASSHVITARHKMKEAGVLVVNYRADKKSRALLGHVRLETRGLVYIDEVRSVHRDILKKVKQIYENTIRDIPDIEEKELLKIVRTDLEKYMYYRLDREPMIIPMITQV
ncbi:ribonuclease J [Candidatus Gracilibacteria bacterium]|nr:ribonuclease J [Candidatus Gracilibacteria bacterium]